MSKFYENLRATNKLPTRGDLQKQSKTKDTQETKLPLSLNKLLELNREDAEKRFSQDRETDRAAYNGTKFIQYDEYGNPAHIFLEDDVAPFVDLQVAENADKLNAILDKYDEAPTWQDKMNVVKQESESFPNKRPAMNYWFDNLAKLTDASMNPKDNYPTNSAESISKVIRNITNSVKNMFFKQA